MRVRHMAALACLVLASCQDKPPNVTLFQLERGGGIEFLCLCEATDGSWSGAPLESCDHRSDSVTGRNECENFALVLQTNRGEMAVVNLDRRRLQDSDERAPFMTFPQVGDFPSDLVVTDDGTAVYVVHAGEPTLAVLPTTGLLGPTVPETGFVDLPAPAESIALVGGGTLAYASMPSIGAIARIDLSTDPPAVEAITVGPDPVPTDEEPEPADDAGTDGDEMDAGDADDLPDAEDDPGEDVPSDLPPDDTPLPVGFMPVEVRVFEQGGPARLYVSGFDGTGGGGVLEIDLDVLESGRDADAALVAVHLAGTPIGPFDVLAVTPDPSHVSGEPGDENPPEGRFLYAANRDEPLLHVVDLEAGLELDTSGGNPLVRGGAMRTDGLVTDVLAVSFDEDLPAAGAEWEPLDLNGTMVVLTTSAGIFEVVDVYDRNCWELLRTGSELSCAAHRVRNTHEEEESYPRWVDEPVLLDENGEALTYLPTNCEAMSGTPCFANADYIRAYADGGSGQEFSYGITFYPETPSNGVLPDVRRLRSETWGMVWEGRIPWTTGVGGNLSPAGDVLSDPGMPFCALGVRGTGMDSTGMYDGDVLVIEDGPDPLGTEADCSDFPAEGGAAYRITGATQSELVLATLDQFDVETGDWLRGGYPLPVEECFPFAVKYHVRASGQWTVTGSETGFLHETVIDLAGRCMDALPPCTEWQDDSCTLLVGRAPMSLAAGDGVYVNPYIRFEILDNGADETILRPGLGFFVSVLSGFRPLATSVATLPHSVAYMEHYGTFFVSDRAWDGLLEFSPSTFSVIYEYN